jgi:hypothetical protein
MVNHERSGPPQPRMPDRRSSVRLAAAWSNWLFVASMGITAGVALASTVVSAQAASAWDSWGGDLRVWVALGHRWLDTGTLYAPFQLAGPYPVNAFAAAAETPALYPPAAGPVFAVLAIAPSPLLILWWVLPVALLTWCLWRWRPARWTWPLIAACLAWPQTPWQFMVGGTSMWTSALVAGGLVWPPLAALILVKPSLAGFALVGIRSRWWWVGAGAIAVLDLVGPWQDYLVAILNGRGSGGLLYSLGHLGLMLFPIIAWLGRRTSPVAMTRVRIEGRSARGS